MIPNPFRKTTARVILKKNSKNMTLDVHGKPEDIFHILLTSFKECDSFARIAEAALAESKKSDTIKPKQ